MDPERRKALHVAISRLADGDRSAMKELVHTLWPVLLDFARRSVRQEQDAEDIAQEVFYRICSRAAEFDRDRDGLSWAFGIASYEILSHRRKQQRLHRTLQPFDFATVPDPGCSQEEQTIRVQLKSALATVLGEISVSEQALLGLNGGGPLANVSALALRKRRQRALDRVRTVWRRLYGEP